MSKKVLFLYKTVDEKFNNLVEKKDQGIYYLPDSTVIAVDIDEFTLQARKILEKEYFLREFEVEQEKFFHVLNRLPRLSARLLNIEINNSSYDPDMENQLDEGIIAQDFEKIMAVIKKFKLNGNDINSLEILMENTTFRMTRLAELDITREKSGISDVLENNFIRHLAGLTREVELS